MSPAGDQVGVGDAAGPGQSFGIHDHSSDPEGGVLSPAVNKNTLGNPFIQPAYPQAFPYPLAGLFGDGSDGDCDAAGLTQLTKDMNFRNLHIFNSGTLYAAGFIVRVWGKLTIDAGGIFCDDGFDGGDGNDVTGAGGVGGDGAIITPILRWQKIIGRYPYNGGAGGAVAAPGVTTAVGGATQGPLYGIGAPCFAAYEAMGGSGGGAIGAAPGAGLQSVSCLIGALSLAGGDAKVVAGGVAVQIGGGGGGGGGGALEFWANEINNAGRITCRGGKGGNGYFKTVGASSSFSGNGSGGNGGILRGFYRKVSGSGLGVIDCAGGLGGINGNGGSTGASGYYEIIQVGA